MVILLKKLKRNHRVKNVSYTSGLRSTYGSWKQQWIKETGRFWPGRCSILDCKDSATDGAHVTTQGLFKYQKIQIIKKENGSVSRDIRYKGSFVRSLRSFPFFIRHVIANFSSI